MPDDLTARVLAIERCPPIEDGPGQVILTTVSHLNRFVFRLTVKDASGKSESLGVTGYHKFYSESRKAWVSAKDLRDGERLGYLQRPVTVAALQQLPGTHRVYNLTVENEHVYYVSGVGALVHNSNCGPAHGTPTNPVQLEDFRTKNCGVHKNSLDYIGETHVYRVRGPNGTYKIGESAQGTRVRDGASIRGEQQTRRLTRETGDFYESEIRKTFSDKRSARDYETRLIKRFRRIFGDDTLPGNKTNR